MKESFSLELAALTRNHTNWYWYGIKIAAFTFVQIKLLQHTSWCWYSTKKNTGIVQNWQVRVVHFYIGTSVQIWCCYIILLNQLFCLTDFFTKQGDTHVAVYWCWYSTELILLVYQIIQSKCKTCHFLLVYYATWIVRGWIKNTT